MGCCTRIAVLYMDTALKHIQIPRPTPSTTNLRRNPTTHVRFFMPLSNQSLKRIVAFNHQKLFCIKNITMADQENRGAQTNIDTEKKGEKKEESPAQPIPPPPEKPLPDDCCGSGCVRCVWDVYYDELEDYNKLYMTDKADSKSS